MTQDDKDRAAKAAIAAMFCTSPESVNVLNESMCVTNRWEAWVDPVTFAAIGDAIATALETAVTS